MSVCHISFCKVLLGLYFGSLFVKLFLALNCLMVWLYLHVNGIIFFRANNKSCNIGFFVCGGGGGCIWRELGG